MLNQNYDKGLLLQKMKKMKKTIQHKDTIIPKHSSQYLKKIHKTLGDESIPEKSTKADRSSMSHISLKP